MRDCGETAKVYRFRDSGRASRFKGKLYAECPTHGRLFADGKQSGQEYILEHATIETPRPDATPEPKPTPAPKPASAPKAAPRAEPPKPAPAPAPKKSGLFFE